MRGLTIDSRQLSNGWVAISVAGEVDIASVDVLQEAIDDAYDLQSGDLAVDLTGSTFMDSTGLKALVMADRKFSENGRSFAIVVGGGPVSRLIDLSGVNATIRTVGSLEDLETDEV
jgi:anti-sigma B factor antagonist